MLTNEAKLASWQHGVCMDGYYFSLSHFVLLTVPFILDQNRNRSLSYYILFI